MAALLFGMAASPAAAQLLAPALDPDEWDKPRQPPLPSPKDLNGTIHPSSDAPKLRLSKQLDNISDLYRAIYACWRWWEPPAGSFFSGQEVTVRVSFKRNGEVLGQPRISYYNKGTREGQRELFMWTVSQTFQSCTPLPFTESFGGAIAGRIFSFRFDDVQPM